MGNAELLAELSEQAAKHYQSFFGTSYLFNKTSLAAFKSSIVDGLTLISNAVEHKERPFTGISPQDLAEKFRDVDLDKPHHSMSRALNEVNELYLNDAVYFHHPKYMAHLNCPIVYPAIVAELILSSINSSLDTWDQSAGGTLIEQMLIDWTCERLQLGSDADGVFTSGGTQSNLMALLLARDSYCEQHFIHSVKQDGLPLASSRFRIFTSSVSHFSVQKSAAILGMGYQSVVSVKVDDDFKMDIEDLILKLKQCHEDNLIPIAIVATAGTTDFGSIDPLIEIAKVAKMNNIWMHVDAAYGCGLLTSNSHRHRLTGIEQADSVTVDFHKSFFQPVSCGAFFAKSKQHLKVVTHHADYLNPLSQSKEGTPNLVNKSIQTTRRFDALKLWLTLRVMGATQLGAFFDQLIELTLNVFSLLKDEPDFEVLNQPELTAIVFRYAPKVLEEKTLERINPEIRKSLSKSGEVMIAATKFDGRHYLKFTFLNPELTLSDINLVIQKIKKVGQSLSVSEAPYNHQ
ncbi:pyridoxal phosphate-dependent decarboxylase family protein [Pleionea sediminis]|uniref:pyridoxal phosphate-dependent decarboxylase family protein n=1 Tax=Pleionea sediminis TaxID=2569479 RepID=UPI001187061B|nr:aspartate aminotransferase family protein [Pleionea sediminis]